MQLRFAQNVEVHPLSPLEAEAAAGQAGGCGWNLSVTLPLMLVFVPSLGVFQGLFLEAVCPHV